MFERSVEKKGTFHSYLGRLVYLSTLSSLVYCNIFLKVWVYIYFKAKAQAKQDYKNKTKSIDKMTSIPLDLIETAD